MILQSLLQLAEREQLIEDPDYEWKPISWLVHVSKDGHRLNIVDIRQTPELPTNSKKKLKPAGKKLLMPREKARQSGDRSFFLYDKAEYVFGIDPAESRDSDTLSHRFQLFRQKLKECLDATQDEAVSAVYFALEQVAVGSLKIHMPKDITSSDLFTFTYEPDEGKLVTNRLSICQYWKGLRSNISETDNSHLCLVSGELFSGYVENFPPTKKIPGGSPSGIALVSFNQKAFESYGWSGNENAPISRRAAEACATALQRLVDPEPRDGVGTALPRRNFRIGDDTTVCFWTSQPGRDDFCDIFLKLMEPDPAEVGELYRSVWRGVAPSRTDESAFYALIISGQQGRIIVRDWMESTVAQVQANLAKYFKDLSIVRNTRPAKDRPLPSQFALNLLMRSLAVRGDRKEIPEIITTHLIRAAINGVPLPFSVLQRAIERERAEQGNREWDDENRRDARVALIKAFLNRWQRLHKGTTNSKEVQTDMDPSNSNEGYILGQTMAVLERIQQLALGNVNASIVDRYFGSASSTPKGTFVRLLKNARYHVRKAQDDAESAGTAMRLDRMLDVLVSRFDVKSNGFPAYLDLNQQGLFILGYHQMRHWLWLKADERDAWEKAHTDAPPAYMWRTGKVKKQADVN